MTDQQFYAVHSFLKQRRDHGGKGRIFLFILNSHKKIEKCSEWELRQTRRRTQMGWRPSRTTEDADGLAPIKDDNAVWHNSRRNRLKVFMGVQY